MSIATEMNEEHSGGLSVDTAHDFTPSSSLRGKCDEDELQRGRLLLQRSSDQLAAGGGTAERYITK